MWIFNRRGEVHTVCQTREALKVVDVEVSDAVMQQLDGFLVVFRCMLCEHGDSPQLLDLVLTLVFLSLHELSSDLFANITIIVFDNHTGAL